VKEAAAREISDRVRVWADGVGAIPDEAEDKEFVAVLALTLIESPDAYQAGRYLDDFMDWPVSGELIQILEVAYARMKYLTRDFVVEWVMQNNVRFPAKKGDMIRCTIGDLEMTGRVIEVIRREATGIFVPNGRNKPMPIMAEEVKQVLPPRKQAPDEPPQPEPDLA